jgi:aminoglycoside phosphotransferase family enzyme
MPSGTDRKRKKQNGKNNKFISLAEKLRFLKRGQHYSENPKRVFNKETHMSWVFLTDVYVYKLKKPVRFDYLDFSSVKKRKEDCEREVELNSRLAEDTYLRVIPLCLDNQQQLQLDGKGKAVDWLLKMRKLDENLMLDTLIKNGEVKKAQVQKAAEHLTLFYQGLEAENISSFDYWNKIMRGVKENYAALLDPVYQLPTDLIKEVITALQLFLTDHDDLLEARVSAGKIVEGHGDLRPEHICLDIKPVIFDCLEFNKELRTVDMADELAFLAMECEMLGNTEVAQWFTDIYQKNTEDNFSEKLFKFYQCNRACLRAKLSAQHINEPQYQNDKKWLEEAKAYLNLANQYGESLSK